MAEDDNTTNDGAEIIPLRPSMKKAVTKGTTKAASERKWGKDAMDVGFCIVPSLLMRAQRRLGLSATELCVLMHLADFWWEAERKPYPSKNTIGERMNMGGRQVQRHIAALEKAGYVKRIYRTAPGKGKITSEYDLSGLVAKLKELAPDFQKVKDEAKKARQAVGTPKGRRPASK